MEIRWARCDRADASCTSLIQSQEDCTGVAESPLPEGIFSDSDDESGPGLFVSIPPCAWVHFLLVWS